MQDLFQSLLCGQANWKEILEQLSKLIGSSGVSIIGMNDNFGVHTTVNIGFTEKAIDDYCQYYCNHDAMALHGFQSPELSIINSREISKHHKDNPFINEFMPENGISQVFTIPLIQEKDRRFAISFQRERNNQKPLTPTGKYFKTFKNLTKTLKLIESQMNGTFQLTNETNQFDSGTTLLLSDRSHIIYATLKDRVHLTKFGLLHPTENLLYHERQDICQKIWNAVKNCTRDLESKNLYLNLSWGTIAHIKIIPGTKHQPNALPSVWCSIIIKSAHNRLDAGRLQSTFNITSAEAQILSALSIGKTAEEIAIIQFVSVNTVRNQIVSLLKKMNCDRQVDAIRLALLTQP